MNLWAKRLGQLAVLAVALFFFSCTDESSLLGLKNPAPKFKVSYVEIPLGSSVMLIDSLRTSNLYSSVEPNRLLAGSYVDDQLGEITASFFTQYFTTNTSKTLLKESAIFDSVSVQLSFDYYTYGSRKNTSQRLSVYEVNKELKRDSLSYYFNRSNTSVNPVALGSKTFSVNPANFKKYLQQKKDTTLSVIVPLDFAFGKKIFDTALRYRSSATEQDSLFVRLADFVKEFKGIAVRPESADKVVGFTPAKSRIILHYHDATADSLQLSLSFFGLAGYSRIESNRSATELSSLTQYHQDFTPNSNLRYIQSGTGITTKIDFTNLYNFIDADTNKNVIINSSELLIKNSVASDVFEPINVLSLRWLKNNNRLRRLADEKLNNAQFKADKILLESYRRRLAPVFDLVTIVDDTSQGAFALRKDDDSGAYSGFFTFFTQELFYKNNKTRQPYWILYPVDPPFGKSLNRIVFNGNDLVLKIYYTRPTITTP